ncbi:MAG: hypothetical protein JXB35_17555 [Anaerolineae bacterium]|nr:hypothetical protein [Anaerolineae bacterium]
MMRTITRLATPVLLALALVAAYTYFREPVTGRETPGAAGQDAPETVWVLADTQDPYYALAEEIAAELDTGITHTLDDALARAPAFLVWVTAPSQLTDDALIDLARAQGERIQSPLTGIISGATLADARALWARRANVQADYAATVNAENPAGNIEAGITFVEGAERRLAPLTLANLREALGQAGYLTFTGHGGPRSWNLDEETQLRRADVPTLEGAVLSAASCNTFRPYETDSIALAFVEQGAAAYAGYAFTPNEGYLFGEFSGAPFRYTWPEFTIGHVMRVQSRGALQGFARLPYYFLLGDPSIAFQEAPPYRLVEDQEDHGTRTLRYAGAPAGVIPVRIAGGAAYAFVTIPDLTSASQSDPFYNSRLQMATLGEDMYLLVDHPGGDLTITLREQASWLWRPGDVLHDSLDHTQLFLFDGDSGFVMFAIGGAALVMSLALVFRKRVWRQALDRRILGAAGGFGLVAAMAHTLYALARQDTITTTSKIVLFNPLSTVVIFALAAGGALVYLGGRTWLHRLWAVILTTTYVWVPLVFSAVVISVLNLLVFRSELGVSLYNYNLAWLSFPALCVACAVCMLTWALLARWAVRARAARVPNLPGSS